MGSLCGNNVDGIATRYGLEGTGIQSWWGDIFRALPDSPRNPPSLPYNKHRVFSGGKTAGAWYWAPTQSTAEAANALELHLRLSPLTACACHRATLHTRSPELTMLMQ